MAPYHDDFSRAKLGQRYYRTESIWRIEAGRLCGRNARNHPVWLRKRLTTNVRIEFDATSYSDDGDIKVELFGDGKGHARSVSYTDATGYVLIYGGWQNTKHVLARLDEHGSDRLAVDTEPDGERARLPVEPGRTYRFRIERRDGRTLRWWVDGAEIHTLSDRKPLSGKGHEYFGFSTWQARVCFDNLSVVPLGN